MLDKETLFKINIEAPDPFFAEKAKSRWDNISKPIDGLGDFEELVCRIAAIQQRIIPDISKRAAVVFCADNGIVEEDVTQSDKSITGIVARALGKGISSANTLADFAKVKVIPIDVGIDSDSDYEGVRSLKVRKGTGNFRYGPAMTEKEALLAIEHGINIAGELFESGYGIISTGELGIGNTTTSAAVISALLGTKGSEIVGRGAGLDDRRLENKKALIREAISKYDFSKLTDEQDRAFSILMTLGGLDIAALTGLYTGAAIHHIPIVIDGLISSAAAVVAKGILPGTRDFMIPSHGGRERGEQLALMDLGLRPYINGNMALGEGTGALMLFPLLDMIMDFYTGAAAFSDMGIEQYKRFS